MFPSRRQRLTALRQPHRAQAVLMVARQATEALVPVTEWNGCFCRFRTSRLSSLSLFPWTHSFQGQIVIHVAFYCFDVQQGLLKI